MWKVAYLWMETTISLYAHHVSGLAFVSSSDCNIASKGFNEEKSVTGLIPSTSEGGSKYFIL
jgi:hypothetical protein